MSATTRKGRRVAAARYPYQAVRGSHIPLIKLLSLLWFHYFGCFQLYLEYELVYRRYRTITSLYQYRTAVYPPPPHLGWPKIAVKPR